MPDVVPVGMDGFPSPRSGEVIKLKLLHLAIEHYILKGSETWQFWKLPLFMKLGKMGMSENVGFIFPMIASHLKTGFADQQNQTGYNGVLTIFRQTHIWAFE